MTTAMKLATKFGLNDMELTKTIAITTKQNEGAIKLLGRINFIKKRDLEEDEIEFQFVNNF